MAVCATVSALHFRISVDVRQARRSRKKEEAPGHMGEKPAAQVRHATYLQAVLLLDSPLPLFFMIIITLMLCFYFLLTVQSEVTNHVQ